MLHLPFVREQFQWFLMSCLFIIRYSGDDIIHVFSWIYIMCLTGGQQRADDRHIDCRLMVSAEEIIFPSQSYRSDDIFSQIVIPKQASVLQTSHHVAPSGIGIRDSFPGLGVGTVLDTFRFHPHLHGSMTGPASSRRFAFRSSYERLALSQQCSIRYICCIWVRACSAISLFSSRACSK